MNTLSNIAYLVIIAVILAGLINWIFTAPFHAIGFIAIMNTAAVIRLALK